MSADLKISIVTPSFNQSAFLEETIRSVLEQNHPSLEYNVIDGGSTDGSVDIIRRYASRLNFWVSEKDGGQYHAINKGFEKTSGEIMGWLNSDDKYFPWTFSVVGQIFSDHPEIEWITTLFPMWWDKAGRVTGCDTIDGFNRRGFWKGDNLPDCGWSARGFIQQESTFWRRSLWEKVGGKLDDSLQLAGDFDLWARFYKHAELYGVKSPLGGFRNHGDQKTGRQYDAYVTEAKRAFLKHGGRPESRWQSYLRVKIFRKLGVPFRKWATASRWVHPRLTCHYDFKSNIWHTRKLKIK